MMSFGVRVVAAGVAGALLGPVQTDNPLPDRQTFLAEAKEKLASDERLQARYTYKLRRTEMGRNPFGRIGTGDTILYEVYPSPIMELTYYRRIARNGVPVSAGDLAEQDRRQRQKLDAYVRRMRRTSAANRERQLQEGSVVGRRERGMVEDVVATLDYRMDRRETLQGRPAIVVTFAPRPSARPWSSEGKLVKHFKGQVWIDEPSRQIARVEAEAIDTMSFGLGFLVRIYAGTKATFTRRPLDNGVWLPAEAQIQGTGRALLLRQFALDFVSEYFDYQPIGPAGPASFVALPPDLVGK